MKLVVLYGPPGVGKLTVAEALAKRTGYKLMHNHLTVDLLLSLFEFGSQPFKRLSRELRHRILEEAAKHGVAGVIFTFVYARPDDHPMLHKLIARMRRFRVRIAWVQLSCEQTELERRVRLETRRRYEKVKSVRKLRQLQRRYNLAAPVPFKPNLVLDITTLKPTVAAQRIVKRFKL
ncbi:MAG: AAA family ATPase [Candidatus Kerfeldbacteria bacterium]|nr:AAA family ATPase [Candidatus Kerfeldbacteria bacterium]